MRSSARCNPEGDRRGEGARREGGEAMSVREVKVKGLNELEKKLDIEFLVQPEIDDARDTIVDRVERRPGKGLGAKKNQLSADTRPLGATVTSTLNYPRTTGTAWGRKNEAIIKSMAGRVLSKAVGRIEQRWTSEHAEGPSE